MQQIRNSANSKAHCNLHHGACAQKILSTFCMQDISYFSQNLLNILFYSETVTNIFSVYAISKIHFLKIIYCTLVFWNWGIAVTCQICLLILRIFPAIFAASPRSKLGGFCRLCIFDLISDIR